MDTTATPTEPAAIELPPKIAKKADNLIRDAGQALVAALIPLVGLVFILRLVQWYLLAREYPSLCRRDGDQRAKGFRAALPRLWFAVLFWPGVFVMIGAFVLWAALTT